MNFFALATLPSVSKERSASTSVDTRPGTIFVSSEPKLIAMRSVTSPTLAPCRRPQTMASSTSCA
jgi:hypothetical protein